jgi:hypothetical protein
VTWLSLSHGIRESARKQHGFSFGTTGLRLRDGDRDLRSNQLNHMTRITTVLVGILAVLIGMGFILPALAKLHSYRMDFIERPLLWGMLLTTGGVSVAVFGMAKRHG